MKPWLAQRRDERPDAPALSFEGDTYSYARLALAVERRAAALAQLGIERGSHVAILGENSVDWVLGAHAVFWLGATLVPLHPGATDEELGRQLEQVCVDLILVDEQSRANDGETPSLRGPRRDILASSLGPAPSLCLQSLDKNETASARPADIRPDDILTILFTSGTTGTPKAVPLTARNHLASARASARRLGCEPDDHWLCCLPLCHIGGLAILLRSAIYGTSFELTRTFEAAPILELLRRRPVTLASFVPTMVHRLVERIDAPITTRLRAVLVGGGPTSAEQLTEARRLGLPVLPTYGMTEAATQLATLAPDDGPDRLDTAGWALSGVELRIERPDGSQAAPGEAGDIWARGPMITHGYLGDDDKHARFRGRWFRTGDVGRLDERGYLSVEHRAGERIVTGGENVDPAEVERVLRDASAVADAAVVGLDDDQWGQRVCALVQPTEPQSDVNALVETLEATCRRRLAVFKVPKQWLVVDQIPRTHTHKLETTVARRLLNNSSDSSQSETF
jgi:o-succinylbenzoate---CoA ligase